MVSPNFQILDNAIDATLFLVDTNGKTLLCTEPGRCVHSTYLVGEEIMDQVLHGEYREQGRLDGMYDSQYYTVGRPVVLDDGLVVGAVFASTPASDLYQFLGEMLRMFAASALTVLIVCFIGLYFATAEMVKPSTTWSRPPRALPMGILPSGCRWKAATRSASWPPPLTIWRRPWPPRRRPAAPLWPTSPTS